MPVVKADAYGHGAVEVAREALVAGAEWLGVASVAEGIELRKVFPGAAICIFSPFALDEAEDIAANRLIPFISDLESARALSRAAQRVRTGVRMHIEIDTGMGRNGVSVEGAARLAEHISRMPSVLITGILTHFSAAESDPVLTERQFALFLKARKEIEATDTTLPHLHCAASAAMLRYPLTRLNLVRPGLLTYGIVPAMPPEATVPALKPAMTVKTYIGLVRELPADSTISYGSTFVTSRPSRIAVIQAGYGDGYPRALSNKGSVLICGQRAKIVGRVCMDVTMVDVTDIPNAQVGGEVVLIGQQGDERIRVEEVANLISTTDHDITTRFTARVPRIYV